LIPTVGGQVIENFKKIKKINDMFDDLFAPMDANTGMSFLDKKSTGNDGVYKPRLEDAKDKKKGYRSVIRFLPNFTKDGKKGELAIECKVHYAKIPDQPLLNGYIDSMRNFPNEKCALTDTYWDLRNSSNVIDNEKAKLISGSTRYYSYIEVIEDEQHPEMEGKVMIFQFGFKIKEKINQERTGEITGEPCNVYDLVNGKDFVLILKEVGGFPNYDASQFKQDSSPLRIGGKPLPVEEINGVEVVKTSVREKVKDFLLTRDVELEDFAPKRWTPEVQEKVNQIVAFLTNSPIAGANNAIDRSSATSSYAHSFDEKPSTPSAGGSTSFDSDDFFDV
jgi:hypothetical protein